MEELFELERDQGRREISKKTDYAAVLTKGSNAVAKPRGGNHAELRKGEYRSHMRWRRRGTPAANADGSLKIKKPLLGGER